MVLSMGHVRVVWELEHSPPCVPVISSCAVEPEPVLALQGMHELLAVIVWTLENSDGKRDETEDAEVADGGALPLGEGIEINASASPPGAAVATDGDDSQANSDLHVLLSQDFVEHDSYILFSGLMTHMTCLYVANDVYDEPPRDGLSADEVAEHYLAKASADDGEKPPIVLILCNEIQHRRLRTADPAVHRNLVALGIEPQLYGLRWVRLLFCREFTMASLHRLWDAILASLFFKTQGIYRE